MFLILAACANGISDPLPADDPPPVRREYVEQPPAAPDVPLCSRRERITVDGFVFDVPLPCDPLPYREFGDPQP